jgi:hypothetical protein
MAMLAAKAADPDIAFQISACMITREFLYHYLRLEKLTVIASTNAQGNPEAAVVGYGATPELEIVFDTLDSSRKYRNILRNPRVALVMGWNAETTVQFEGEARLLAGPEDDSYREAYYAAYPDGRDRTANWKGLVHFAVKPLWIRYSDFGTPSIIEELRF